MTVALWADRNFSDLRDAKLKIPACAKTENQSFLTTAPHELA